MPIRRARVSDWFPSFLPDVPIYLSPSQLSLRLISREWRLSRKFRCIQAQGRLSVTRQGEFPDARYRLSQKLLTRFSWTRINFFSFNAVNTSFQNSFVPSKYMFAMTQFSLARPILDVDSVLQKARGNLCATLYLISCFYPPGRRATDYYERNYRLSDHEALKIWVATCWAAHRKICMLFPRFFHHSHLAIGK